ncbi:MAG: hydrogenase formation protein HypD [Cyanophyceae cyanobacterium]
MKFIDEYRDAHLAHQYAQAIARLTTRPWTMMEICGGQTHSIVKYGVNELLPSQVTLIHGPGCPVCVTAPELIEQAIALAGLPEVMLCSFGDMLRVPAHHQGSAPQNLLAAKAAGSDVRLVYSPLDALKLAQENPDKQVVFFAVGFETTAPTTAMVVYQAAQQQIENFSLLVAHVRVPPAMQAILSSSQNQVQGFLAAGHVCTVMGYTEYEAIAKNYRVPIVVTGFEPIDILQGIYLCIGQLESGTATVENQYARSVRRHGNEVAQQLMGEIFEVVSRPWRGIGEIPQSGLGLRSRYARFDAQKRFRLFPSLPKESPECISGLILQGVKKPPQCPAFGKHCTPEHPLGAPMVSSEGACAAYHRYRTLSSESA